MSHHGADGVCVIIEDSDLTDDEPGPSRSVVRPSACSLEAAWFNQPFYRPSDQVVNSDIPEEVLSKFQELIWNAPHDRMVPGYGLTPKELASVSSDGRKGWLVTSHFYWLSRCLNQQQQHTRFFVLDPAIRKASVEKLLSGRSVQDVNQLIFVLSVGRQDDGIVFLGNDRMQGDHWSVAVVDLVTRTVSYCDTLGWPAPEHFLPSIINYTNILGLTQTSQLTIRMAHRPNSEQHNCTAECTNYPLQTCSDVCGVIAMVCIATAALDRKLFELLLTPINKDLNLYLTDPTLYSSYLRHVLILWLVTGYIDITRISLKEGFSPLATVNKAIANLKRKLEINCNGDNADSFKRRMRTVSHHTNDVNINDYILEALETDTSSEDLLLGLMTVFGKHAEEHNGGTETMESYVAGMSFNSCVERHKEDVLSTKSYVRDLIAAPDYNPVLLYKGIGKKLATLNPEDKLVAIQTPFQKEMMKMYGKNCVCVDVKKEGETVCLVTVLVFFEGRIELPVAWLITEKYNPQILSHFIKSLFINTGDLQTDVFLGDMNMKTYKIWTEHFSKPGKRMFNPWEVLYSLTSRLESLVPDEKVRKQIKCYLNIMFMISDIKAFRAYLQAFLDFLNPFQLFCTNFKTKFIDGGKDEFWASCYRHMPVNKRIPFLNPPCRILKELGLYGKQKVTRFDLVLHRLLQFIRFVEIKIYIQPNRNRLEQALRDIEKQHNKNTGNLDIYQSASGDEWYIRASAETNSYSVVDSGRTDCSCELRCTSCKICVHRYICSCCDFLLSAGSCKHIHVINSYRKMNSVINNTREPPLSTGDVEVDDKGDCPASQDLDVLRAETLKTLMQLSHKIPAVKEARTLQNIQKLLQPYTQH